jgi:hypothetical protein
LQQQLRIVKLRRVGMSFVALSIQVWSMEMDQTR